MPSEAKNTRARVLLLDKMRVYFLVWRRAARVTLWCGVRRVCTVCGSRDAFTSCDPPWKLFRRTVSSAAGLWVAAAPYCCVGVVAPALRLPDHASSQQRTGIDALRRTPRIDSILHQNIRKQAAVTSVIE